MSDQPQIKYEERNDKSIFLKWGFPLTGSGKQWQVDNLAADNISFNVLKHDLVPEHHLLSVEEAEKVLSEMGMTCDQLPKIRNNDAGIKVLESIHGPITEGRVVRIVRKSETAQEFVAYRLVTKG